MWTKKSLFLGIFAGIFACGCSSKVANNNSVSEKENEKTVEKTTMVVISTDFGEMKAVLYNETPLHKVQYQNYRSQYPNSQLKCYCPYSH